jgi:hypothetical protein
VAPDDAANTDCLDSGEGSADIGDDEGAGGQSRVGKKLTEMTTKKLIAIVLAMLLVLPFLKVDDPIPRSAQVTESS